MRKGKHNKKSLKGRSKRGGLGEEGNNSSTSSDTGSDTGSIENPNPNPNPVENLNLVENPNPIVNPGPIVNPFPVQNPTTSSNWSWKWPWPTQVKTCKKNYEIWSNLPLCDNVVIGGKRRHRRTQKKHYNKKPSINIKGIVKVYSTKNITRKRLKLHKKRR